MTQLTVSAEPRLSEDPSDGQLSRLKQRLRIGGRPVDIVDLGITLWLTMWAACVSASVVLLAR
jgi:hypothetical protein